MGKNKLTALDIFAGAGGLSYGFSDSGFEVIAAIEKDAWACDTLSHNLPNTKIIQKNIEELTDFDFASFKGIDAVIGGPPCQGFSISASNRRKSNDKRNFYYQNFLKAVNIINPSVILVENVKEFASKINNSGQLVIDEVTTFLKSRNYSVSWKIINSVSFGVPQNRIRLFLLASKYATPVFPILTHSEKIDLISKTKPLTIWDAISDLPKVYPRELREDDVLSYKKKPQNYFQKYLRGNNSSLYNHIPMRHTERLIERFSSIDFNEKVADLDQKHAPRMRGNSKIISGKYYSQNHRRLKPNSPSCTITASFYSSFIHPYQHRNLTVREAARIQTFPDSFRFLGKRTTLSKKLLQRKGIYEDLHLDQFNQVGNAVPPLMASLLADSLSNTLFSRTKKAC